MVERFYSSQKCAPFLMRARFLGDSDLGVWEWGKICHPNRRILLLKVEE